MESNAAAAQPDFSDTLKTSDCQVDSPPRSKLSLSTLAGGLARYLLPCVASALLIAATLHLHWRDLDVPLDYRGDVLLTSVWIKGMMEHGWYLHNDAVGAPHGLDMYDFPMADNLHFGLMKCLALGSDNYAKVYNLYFLLTFPLTTLVALIALRQLNISYSVSVLISLLYSFIPYHIYRGIGHMFLASYYLVPLNVLVSLWIYLDEIPFLPANETGGMRKLNWRKLTAAGLICLLSSSAGVYYAFFACFFFLVAGLAAVFQRRRAPLAAALVLTVVVSAGMLANLSPSFYYIAKNGPNISCVYRSPADAETYGLKIVQMLLPTVVHPLRLLAKVRQRYVGLPITLVNENESAALGLIASIGFVILTVQLFRRTGNGREARILDGLSLFNVLAVLLATVGGFGAFLAMFGLKWIRGYNRISVYIAFFCLLAIALLLDQALRRYSASRKKIVYFSGLFVLVFVVGILDHVGLARCIAGSFRGKQRQEYAQDAEFIHELEATLPENAMIFQLPYCRFPESHPVHKMDGYDPCRPYLHSTHLRWSHGPVAGREGDYWQRAVVALPLPETLRILSFVGFRGLLVDRYGFKDRGKAIEADLKRLLDVAPKASDDERLLFFDMNVYNQALQRSYTAEEWAMQRERATRSVWFVWYKGFDDFAESATPTYRKCNACGEMHIDNATGGSQTVTWTMKLRGRLARPARLLLECAFFRKEVTITDKPTPFSVTFNAPPGIHVVKFTWSEQPLLRSSDVEEELAKPWMFSVSDFRVETMDQQRPAPLASSKHVISRTSDGVLQNR